MNPVIDGELKQAFLSECFEHLDMIEADLLDLERGKMSWGPEVIHRMFRGMHSVKGSAAVLELTGIGQLSHLSETVLEKLREGELQPSVRLVEILLATLDRLRFLTANLEEHQDEASPRETASLRSLLQPAPPPPPEPPPEAADAAPVPAWQPADIPAPGPPRQVKVLVVDANLAARSMVRGLLAPREVTVREAASAQEALDLLAADPEVKLVVVGHSPPAVNGPGLVGRLRSKYDRRHLAIVGLSDRSNAGLTAALLRNGASDFASRPLVLAEFLRRVDLNLELVGLWEALEQSDRHDRLTGLHHGKYFMEEGRRLYQQTKSREEDLSLALVCIDKLKNINEHYGHQGGDACLQQAGTVLRQTFGARGLVARLGGGEFAALVPGLDEARARVILEVVRRHLAGLEVLYGDKSLKMTVSIGVTTDPGSSLEEMVALAGKRLDLARRSGGDVVMQDT
ncbi:MAG: diguanylate cyclase [Deltaproteobacteria bacterium]|nr:diguanylate cyclase [Deltaproteobacteria bacterium]